MSSDTFLKGDSFPLLLSNQIKGVVHHTRLPEAVENDDCILSLLPQVLQQK